MDWSRISNGIEPRLTKCGIVIHHVNKVDIEPRNTDTYHNQIQTLEEENERCNLHVSFYRVGLLREYMAKGVISRAVSLQQYKNC
jgi:hypothetical protein